MISVSNFNFIENIDDFECNSKGYNQFLNQWSYEDKCTSRDPSSLEYKQRLEYFIDSCKKIHEHNKLGEYPLEFTFYADWHSSEFEMITTTTQQKLHSMLITQLIITQFHIRCMKNLLQL